MKKIRKLFSRKGSGVISLRLPSEKIGMTEGMLLLGILLGALLCRRSGTENTGLIALADSYLSQEPDFWSCFGMSFASLFAVFLLLFLSGLSAVGGVTIPLCLLFHGIGIGAGVGILYLTRGWRGFEAVLLLLFPKAYGSALLFFKEAREGNQLSGRIRSCFFPTEEEENPSLREAFRRYCVRSAVLLLFLSGIAFLDSLLRTVWGSHFA